jgi:hypothetical protein
MVDMSVRKKHGIHGMRIKRQRPVAFKRLFSTPLKETAIEQYPLAIHFNQMSGAGDGLGST